MSRITIPPASANRLRQAYAQVEQLSALIAEAMGIDPMAVTGVDIPGGAFLLKDEEQAPFFTPEEVRRVKGQASEPADGLVSKA